MVQEEKNNCISRVTIITARWCGQKGLLLWFISIRLVIVVAVSVDISLSITVSDVDLFTLDLIGEP